MIRSMWVNTLSKESIFFVTPDIKRGIGLEDLLPNYHIICSYFDPIIKVLRNQGANIFCLEEVVGKEAVAINNSSILLERKEVLDYVKKHSSTVPWIMYFKPSLKLDLLIAKYKFKPIGNSSVQNEYFENKTSVFPFLEELMPESVIRSIVGKLGLLRFSTLKQELGISIVVQFGHGWAGKTTFFIKSEKEFTMLQGKYPNTLVRISQFVDGYTILNNCCVYQDCIFVGPPAFQIQAIPKLHPNPAVTCGRQWPTKKLSQNQVQEVHNLSTIIGKKMADKGYKGFFGLDFLVDEHTGKIFISEVNARLTASAAFYTKIEIGERRIPLLAHHLASFIKENLETETKSSVPITASQVIFRLPIKNIFGHSSGGFGVFSISDKQLTKNRDEYNPYKLTENEFILMQRVNTKKNNSEEKARIEVNREVLDEYGKLKTWVENLFD